MCRSTGGASGSLIDFEAVFHAGAAPSVLLAPDLVIMAVNDAYEKVTGRSRGELLGRNILAVFPENPHVGNGSEVQGVQALRMSLERVLATGEKDVMALQRYDLEAAGRPGVFEERYWSTVNTPISGTGGEAEIIHSTEDVTELVRHLRRSSRRRVAGLRTDSGDVHAQARELLNLNQRLTNAYLEQRETTSALREAIERQRRLVFDASHDLRNPITALLTELEDALTEPDIDLRRTLHKLLRDAERLNEIVGDLLDLARLDAPVSDAVEEVDLADFVLEELERHRLTHRVHTRLGKGAVVCVSRIRLARLLGNLISNAERHTHSLIEIFVTVDRPDAVLEVIDDGPGIAPADRERIFERFCRLGDARDKDHGGSGLGLPIAREIAKVYGGRLYAADHPTGARFVLRLPLGS